MQNADGAVSFREPLSQTKVMQIRQRETQSHQGAITHDFCCLSAEYTYKWGGDRIGTRV